MNRTINLASTNYPERLDRRIISRPRRFDRILRIEDQERKVGLTMRGVSQPTSDEIAELDARQDEHKREAAAVREAAVVRAASDEEAAAAEEEESETVHAGEESSEG